MSIPLTARVTLLLFWALPCWPSGEFPNADPRYNCPRSYTFPNANLRGGLGAGTFLRLGPADDSELCIQRCCHRPSCDLVAWVGAHCYAVSCSSAELCRPVKLPRYTKGMKLLYIAARDGAQDKVELYKRESSESNESPGEDQEGRVKNINSQSFKRHARRIIRSLEEIDEIKGARLDLNQSEGTGYAETFPKQRMERSAGTDEAESRNTATSSGEERTDGERSEQLEESGSTEEEFPIFVKVGFSDSAGSGFLERPGDESSDRGQENDEVNSASGSSDASGLVTKDESSDRGQENGDLNSVSGSAEASGLVTKDESSDRGQENDDLNSASGSAEASGLLTEDESSEGEEVKFYNFYASGSASGNGPDYAAPEDEQKSDVKNDVTGSASGSAEWSGTKASEKEEEVDFRDSYASGSAETDREGTEYESPGREQRGDVSSHVTELSGSGPEDETSERGQDGSAEHLFGSGTDPGFVKVSRKFDALQSRYNLLVHNQRLDESDFAKQQSVPGSVSNPERQNFTLSSATSYESQLMSDRSETNESLGPGAELDDVTSGSGSGSTESLAEDDGPPRDATTEKESEQIHAIHVPVNTDSSTDSLGLESGPGKEASLMSDEAQKESVQAENSIPDNIPSGSGVEESGTEDRGQPSQRVPLTESVELPSDRASVGNEGKTIAPVERNLTSLFKELKRDMSQIFHGEVQDYLKAFDAHIQKTKAQDKMEDNRSPPGNTTVAGSWKFPNNVNRVSFSDRQQKVDQKQKARLSEGSLQLPPKAHNLHSKVNGSKPWMFGPGKVQSNPDVVMHSGRKIPTARNATRVSARKAAAQWDLETSQKERGGKDGARVAQGTKMAAKNFHQIVNTKNGPNLVEVIGLGDGFKTKAKTGQKGHKTQGAERFSVKMPNQTEPSDRTEAAQGKKTEDKPKNRKAAKKLRSSQIKDALKIVPDELSSELEKLQFRNGPATVYNSTRFAYLKQCGLYVEQYNVTKTRSSWNNDLFTPYPYLYELPKDYHKCGASAWMNHTDFRGSVFLSFRVMSKYGNDATHNGKLCEKYCCREQRCEAWTLRLQKEDTANCEKGSYCCWLKSSVPTPIPNSEYCTSGIVKRQVSKPPPSGMRSAVPLGGLGTGSFELRADGTFHEWTIENQSPGGSAKLNKGALDMALLGVRVAHDKKSEAALLRIHPPEGYPGVDSLSYSGAYPVTKLTPEGSVTKHVDMDLYAYPHFRPRDAANSSVPAVAFTLSVRNNDKARDAHVAFMLNLPLGYQEDTIRAGDNFGEVVLTRLNNPADCAHACAKMPRCLAWTTNGPTSCLLKDKMPLHAWASGIVSGLKGFWSVDESMLTCSRPGFFPQSGSTSLQAVDGDGRKVSFAVVDDFKKIWKEFSRSGDVSSAKSPPETGLHGAASTRLKLKPGEHKSLTIIMSWHYPHRDMSKVHIGNYYTNTFQSSQDVAKRMRKDLVQSVQSIQAWHRPIFGPSSRVHRAEVKPVNRLPEWLQDLLVNSVSFWRGAFWTKDGRFRQWEALDCNDVDTIQHDMQRIVPHLLFYPELVRNVLVAWASNQYSSGMMQEALTPGCLGSTGKLDFAGGRTMADTTAMFVVGLYQYYLWTGDQALLDQLWPSAKRAMTWVIVDSTKGTGLPFRKVSNYDLIELDKYDHDAYNSFVYLLALKAATKLAERKHDEKFARRIKQATAQAQKHVQLEFWDDKGQFYRAWWDMEYGSPEWLMSDTLYGQLWAYTLDLGDLVPRKNLMAHLESEELLNDTPFGLKVLNTGKADVTLEDTSFILGGHTAGCKSLQNITKHSSVWMGADADWASLTVHLGADPNKALKRAEKALDHWRSELNDQWNIHGLVSSQGYGVDGLPWATSHYSFHVLLWHLPFAVSGQKYSAPERSLEFWPKFPVPFELPFFTPSASGLIKGSDVTTDGKQEEMFTLQVTSGRLRLKKLAVSGSTYGDRDVTLSTGDSVTWSRPKQDVEDILKQL